MDVGFEGRFSLRFSLLLELHVIVGNVKEVSLSLVLAGQRYTVEPLARAEVKQLACPDNALETENYSGIRCWFKLTKFPTLCHMSQRHDVMS